MSKILVVDDEQSILTTLELLLTGEDYRVVAASAGNEAISLIEKGDTPDLVITDIRMPGFSGIELLKRIKAIDPYIEVIIITAHADKQMAIEALNAGAYYFLEKPFENHRLLEICREALEHGHALQKISESERKRLARRKEAGVGERVSAPTGESPCFVEAMELVRRAAETDSTILIRGESGTGKEIVARYIYSSSARAGRPFVTVNCGALTETLLESELFGHVKGSFTGAISNKDGLFKVAHGGTIFLDEIGDTSLGLQVKLLRVLQEKEITPVGSTQPVLVDVRVIAATNRDLEKDVRERQFREDLYYRLNVIPIQIPPLRERREDIPLLIDYFLKRGGGSEAEHGKRFSPGALKLMMEYSWPGNIRQLENVVEQLSVICPSERVMEKDLPERIREPETEAFVSEEDQTHADTRGYRTFVYQLGDGTGWRQQAESRRNSGNRSIDTVQEVVPLTGG